MGETILTNFFEREKISNNEEVIIFAEDIEYNFEKFNDLSSRLATGIKLMGIKKGENVGLLMPNIPEFLISYYGILKSGCVVVPINILSKIDDIKYIIRKSCIKCLIYWSKFENKIYECLKTSREKIRTITTGVPDIIKSEKLQDILEGNWPAGFDPFIKDSDPAVIQFTSGTSGNSKGAVLTHRNLYEAARIVAEIFRYSPEDRILASLPLFHPFAQSFILNSSIVAGSKIILHQRFDPEKIIESFLKEKITIFVGVPSMFKFLLKLAPEKRNCLDSLRCFISSGGKFSSRELIEFEEMYKKPILEAYGTAETFFVTSFNRLYGTRKPGSVGFQPEKIDIKVVNQEGEEVFPNEVGEITVKGVTVSQYYYNSPEETNRNLKKGWLYTGDMGKIDLDGFLYPVDRKEDIIKKGGFIVYPKEVEEIIYENEKVKEAAIIGIPDKDLYQEVKAFVVLKDNEVMNPEELIEFCKQRLPNYKAPKYVEFLDKLPKNYSGKILKRLLKKPAS